MARQLILVIAAALISAACKTPEGPRLALPPQDLSTPVPAGYVRVVFFNDTFEPLNYATGTIRIQIDGKTAPSLYLNHYAQLFLKPGQHEVMLEHWDLFTFTDRYQVEIQPPEAYFRVWTTPLGNKYEHLESLPPDFRTRFTGGRDPLKWQAFEPE
jgi:hypothetical protein